MKPHSRSPSSLMLQLSCVIMRINPLLFVAAGLFGLGLLLATLWVSHLHNALLVQKEQARRLKSESMVSRPEQTLPLSQNELRLQNFFDNLGDNGYAEQQLKTIFDIAAKKNLKLNAGEYKSGEERNSDTVAYQIQLPVNGPYAAIREFCEEVLLAIPFASLDEISIKREVIGRNNLDAKLKFTLYLNGKKKAVQP